MDGSKEVKILHVSLQYEADSAVATLEQGGVAAYSKPSPNYSLLALRSTMGINESGYDVYVTASNIYAATEILRGIGYSSEYDTPEDDLDENAGTDQIDSETDTVSSQKKGKQELTDEDKRAILQKSIEELPRWKWTLYKIGFALMLFLAVYIFIVLCDTLIGFVKTLF